MTKKRYPHVGTRLSEELEAELDSLAVYLGLCRSEALRVALVYGIPLARLGTKLNVARFAVCLEYTMAASSVIISREHSDFLERVESTVSQRLDEFHA